MRFQSAFPFLMMSTAALGLSACNLATTSPSGAPADTSKTYTTVLPETAAKARVMASRGDLGTVLSSGATLTSRPSLGKNLSGGEATGVLVESSAPLQLTRHADGSFTAVFQGETFEFDKITTNTQGVELLQGENLASGTKRIQIASAALLSANGKGRSITDWLTAGKGSHTPVIALRKTGEEEADLGFFILGAETEDAAMSGLGKVSYSGKMGLYTTYAGRSTSTDQQPVGSGEYGLNGDLTMNADFDKGTISGSVTGLKHEYTDSKSVEQPDGTYKTETKDVVVPHEGSLVFEPTTFTGNGYRGTVTVKGVKTFESDAGVTGDYSGAFFGPKADETGGVFSIDSAPATQNENLGRKAIGFFSAKQ